MSDFEAGCDLLGGWGAQCDAAYDAIIVKVSVHVVLAGGHGQTWIGLKPASTESNALLEFSTKNGNREWNNSTQLVREEVEASEVGQVP